MSRLQWAVSAAIAVVIGGYVLAYWLGETPTVFWLETFPRIVGACIGGGLFLFGLAVTVVQVSKR